MSRPPEWPDRPSTDAAPTADADSTSADADSTADDTADPSSVPDVDLRPALERLRIERRILSDEQSAFRSFCDRLFAIEGEAPTDEIVAHYRGTAMAVPHYWSEYGDTAEESLAAEIGTGLARDLELRERVDAATVTAIRRAGERSLRARDELVDRIDAERHAVATAAEELEAVRRELLAPDADGSASGGGATRLTLASLRERCDAVGRRRREHLQPDDTEAATSGSEDAGTEWTAAAAIERNAGVETGRNGAAELPPGRLQSLCYRELDVDWPVIAGVEALREAIEARRRAVLERES